MLNLMTDACAYGRTDNDCDLSFGRVFRFRQESHISQQFRWR